MADKKPKKMTDDQCRMKAWNENQARIEKGELKRGTLETYEAYLKRYKELKGGDDTAD